MYSPDFLLIIVLLFKVTLLLFLRRKERRMERTKLFSYFIIVYSLETRLILSSIC